VHPPRFLVDALPDGNLVRLDGAEGRHAATVRRLRVGEAIAVGDGRGSVRAGVVAEVGRDSLVARCGPVRFEPAPAVRLVVVQALAKGDRGELAVELMTELGVDEIVPWAASRSIVQWHGARGDRARERWVATARSAAKQSRRAWVPRIGPTASTADVAGQVTVASRAVVLHEPADLALTDLALPPDAADLLVVVGPEGGVSDDELAAFEAAGAQPARLGAAVLRTSTAGAAACAALSVLLRRW
jgi:16S rRNA (uracil1498-N3)-methyltransferase